MQIPVVHIEARHAPYVLCHMCTTIDGKIIGERWGELPGGGDSGKLFERTAASLGIRAWLVGNTTMHEFDQPTVKLTPTRKTLAREDFIADPGARGYAIGADAKGSLRYRNNTVGADHVLLLLSEQVSNDYLMHLRRARVSYLFCGTRRIHLPVALRKLRSKLGLRRLILEGGGAFNGAMLRAGLIDEISQVIVPIVDGGVGVRSFFDIPGRAPKQAAATLRFLSHPALTARSAVAALSRRRSAYPSVKSAT